MELGTIPGTTVIAADRSTGVRLLSEPDTFVDALSQFDRQSRLGLRVETIEVTTAMYLDYVASHVMEWTLEELAILTKIVQSIAGKLQRLEFSLPAIIHLVKTTGEEEGHAAYTRHENVVVLPVNMVQSLFATSNFGDPLHSGTDPTYLENVLIHELFHLFSKNNPARRWNLYDLVHYESTGGDVALPDVPWPGPDSPDSMPALRITNPDTPSLDTFIRMAVDGPSGAVVDQPLLPVLLARGPYDGGVFFEYLEWWFVAIEQVADGWSVRFGADGRPLMYESSALLGQYRSLVGANISSELFHPDEVLAQNWVLVANEPSLGVLEGIDRILQHPGAKNSKALLRDSVAASD